MVKLLSRTHARPKLPPGFTTVRCEVPRLTTVHELQSGPATSNPFGSMLKTQWMASLGQQDVSARGAEKGRRHYDRGCS